MAEKCRDLELHDQHSFSINPVYKYTEVSLFPNLHLQRKKKV